jgi:ATP-dependent Lon protease
MVLSGCNLLPHGLLPLYIFESRYRQMLADSLESERLIAIGTVDPASTDLSDEPAVFKHSCAGLVRACVEEDDGTSHLILQGLQRIRFTAWPDYGKSYRIAEIEAIPSLDENSEASIALSKRALELAKELISAGHHAPSPNTFAEIEALTDPEPLADLLAYHLIRDPHQRQALLSMSDIGERLRYLIAQLSTAGPSLP